MTVFLKRRVAVLLAGLLAVAVCLYAALGRRQERLPYHDNFAKGSMKEWQAFGGDWAVSGVAIRNGSDERGAKLVAGSRRWRNYLLEADVALLGQDGNAGLVIRSSEEENGVDAYSGYYAGLRIRDSSLVLGRADHEWQKFAQIRLASGDDIRPFQWYQLTLAAQDCDIVALVRSVEQRMPAAGIHWRDPHCVPNGRLALRSFSSGGLWRHVVAKKVSGAVFATLLKTAETASATAAPLTAPKASTLVAALHTDAVARPPAERTPIGDLRLTNLPQRKQVSLRGVVILTAPALFVQDQTGGVEVHPVQSDPLKIGDEVEVAGVLEVDGLHMQLSQARVQPLWSQSPPPAVAVSAAQAATGAYDGQFVEAEGRINSITALPSGGALLQLSSGAEDFQAVVRTGHEKADVQAISVGSVVRLKGVCVVSPRYTSWRTPFALLVRSDEDVVLVSGPPWWNLAHVSLLLLLAVGIVFLATRLYSRIERWRLQAVFLERERLAQEMHDTLAQSFAGLGFQLEAIRHSTPVHFNGLHQRLDVATHLVRHSHEEARRSIAALRPETLETGELVRALDECARRLVQGGAITIHAEAVEGAARPIPLRLLDHLYRIGQEALANTVSHAEAKNIWISLRFGAEDLCLCVRDDGTGFDPQAAHKGFGLQGMQKRTCAVGGTLHVHSSPQGSLVKVHAPLSTGSLPRTTWRLLSKTLSER